MTTAHTNVGHADALARRIVGTFAIVAGAASLEGFFFAMPFLTWLVLAFMFSTGLFFLLAGFHGGTGVLGFLTMALAVLDGWLALNHLGTWALLLGLAAGADALVTAARAWSPLNALFHRDTHDADAEWGWPAAPVH
ncbi:MAG TPA: hypothetical protein VLV16_14120 [Gemmatimonadales bacterium]|nr:hypothetical protein [Gemmatimonadales bacterium]